MPFSKFGLYSSILRAVEAKGYAEPTPVQVETIPAVLAGRDVIASAQTGTGKTAAFALPIINRLGPHRAGGARVLVLEPTRELAQQVATAFREFAQFTDLHVDLIQGGVGYGKQRSALVDGADIVVATVGRLLELIDDHAVKLDALQVLVLDEVDRMLDMGFIDDVRAIVGRCPPKRQTLFFSATIPGKIEEVARFAVRDPIRISIGRVRTVPGSVKHELYPVSGALKFPLLLALLGKTEYRSVIIFCRTKEGADGIVARIKRAGHSATVLHGDRSTGQRKASLAGFKDGTYEILVATDIASRGLDLSEVSHVINYDIPMTPDDYVHRVGRTGRADADGWAFSLASLDEMGAVGRIDEVQGTPSDWHPLSELTAPAGAGPLRPPMMTLQILGGRKEKIRPGDVLGALTKDLGLPGAQVGKIVVNDFATYVAVERGVADQALRGLSAGKVKGRSVKVRRL